MNRTPARDSAISTPSQQPSIAESSYPPIADYSAIGDGRTVALISRAGAIEWLCLPHFSAPSAFAALLDRDSGGVFAIAPERHYTSTRRYIDDTNVLETTFSTTTGVVRVTDFMPMPADPQRLEPMREVLRIVEGVEGNVALSVIVDPRPDYGRRRARRSRVNALGCTWSWGNELLTLKTDAPLSSASDTSATALDARVTIAAGTKYSFSLCYAKGDIGCSAPLGVASEQRLASTLEWWKQWARRCSYDGPYRSAVIRSALAVKLMTYSLSGGVIAAPTTSLPEALGGSRNWDYRYCWMRDAALTMRAFTDLGFKEEARAFFAWLLHTTRLTWPKLQVLYDVHGRTDVPEFELPNWEGYARSKPVRIGNGAAEQLQLDTYGGVLSAALDYVRSGGEVQADEAKLLAGFGRSVLKLWMEPDNGIWEIRGGCRNYTLSKFWCWVALDCLLELQERGVIDVDTAPIRAGREAIAHVIEAHGFNARLQSYVQTFDGDRADASLLLMACLGYKDPNDPRMRGTYDLICKRLGRNGLLYRYERDVDGLPPGEGAFGICSFWAVDYLVCRGDVDDARAMFEHVISLANDLALFAEEIDPEDGSQLGNFPQAFTHVGVIFAALSLARAQRRKERGR
jgi:GH15 family glucan-1,4-alpha-glucosidase